MPDSLAVTDLARLPIETFVPHRGAMCWLTRLVSVDGGRAVAEAVVRPDMLFVEQRILPSWVAIEFMAQTIAAWAGYNAWREGRAVHLGFLLGSRRFEAWQPGIPVGSRLRIETQSELLVGDNLGIFACSLFADGQVLAQANLSVYGANDERAFAHRSL